MSGQRCKYFVAVPLAVLIVGTIAAWTTNMDIGAETLFFDAASKSWPIGKIQPFDFAYRYGELTGWIPILWAVVVLALGWKMAKFRQWRRASIFLIAVMALGPGLLVNAVFKEHWNRPRPREIVQFGGRYEYQKPLVIGENGEGKKSFPSGHAAMGFFFIAPYFILLAKDRRAAHMWLMVGVAYGLYIGLARMVQGAHWPSDVLWSFGFLYLPHDS